MATISKIKISNVDYDLKGSPLYGVCTSSKSTEQKSVTVDGSFTLYTGAIIMVKFIYSNNVASPTLNVNDSGAKNILYYDNSPVEWNADNIKILLFDGTNWIIINKDSYVEIDDFNQIMESWDNLISEIVCNLYGITNIDDYSGESIETIATNVVNSHSHDFSGVSVTSTQASGTNDIYQITDVGTAATQSYQINADNQQRLVVLFDGGSVPTRSKVSVPTANHTHDVVAKGSISAPHISES